MLSSTFTLSTALLNPAQAQRASRRSQITYHQPRNSVSKRSFSTLKCSASSDDSSKDPVNVEDMAAKLAAAQAEAEKLKEQLAKVQPDTSTMSVDELAKQKMPKPDKRIDGTGYRETLFSIPKEQVGPKGGDGWLREGDLEFFTGNGVSEASGSSGLTDEQQGEVNRRLLLGLGASAIVGALSLIPSDKVRLKPPKPLPEYLVPLLRVLALLPDVEGVVLEGDWTSLEGALKSILGSPNNLKENLNNAALCLDDDRTYDKAMDLEKEVIEYLKQVSFKEYFDSRTPPVGSAAAEYQKFAVQSAQTARKKLQDFLDLMPKADIAQAKSQMAF